MARVTCSRCFSVFEDPSARPLAAALCPACAARSPARTAPAAPPPAPQRSGPGHATPARASRRPGAGRRVAVAAALLAGVLGSAVVLVPRLRAPPPAPAPVPTRAEETVERWREAGRIPPAPHASTAAAVADARIADGEAALAADLPGRAADALQAFREALGAVPGRWEAAAGFAEAVADLADEDADADGGDLRDAHELVAEARASAGDPPRLLAALARLLHAVPSATNRSEALGAARRALTAAPGDARVQLAAGLALGAQEPRAGAEALEAAWRAGQGDRRLLAAAARARWAAGDAREALRLAAERLALDPLHPRALALAAEVEAASGRLAAARARLSRWEALAPGEPLPALLLARLDYQADHDAAAARTRLAAALARSPKDFLAARIHAHRAALARLAGDRAAAAAEVAAGLARVPASAPVRFQAALLAFDAGDARGLRESAGVLGERGGALAARVLAARSAELSGTIDDAIAAWRAVGAAAPRDPVALLGAAGALVRLGASGPALAVARAALARDPLEARPARPPTDFWEGPGPLAEAAERLETVGRSEARAGGTAFAAASACELALGHTVNAERLARAAAAAAPQTPVPLALLAQIALDRGDARRAFPLARAAVEADEVSATALSVRARALEALGRNADAEAAHRAAVEVAPDLVPSRVALARLLARRGAAAEARPLLEGLLAEEPGLVDARGALLDLDEPPPGAGASARRPSSR